MDNMAKGFVNGKIYTSFRPRKVVNGLVVANGRILYAGEEERAKKITSLLNGELIDLEGKVVLPGFIDSHMHLDELGIYLNMVDLRGVKSIEDLKHRVKDYAEKAKTTWILGHGWDQELFKERRWPTRWDLDSVVKDRPVMLSRICLHSAVLNTKAMELTDLLTMNSHNVVKDENGEPIGIVKEEAFDLARKKFKETLSLDDYEKFLRDAMSYVSSYGVTTVSFVSCDENSIRGLCKLWERGEMPIRVRVYLNPEKSEILKELGIKRGFGDERLKINGIKILCDGSFGSRTAWLSEPYSDEPSTQGHPNIEEERLKEIVKEAHNSGLQLAIHGIGDRAIDMILNAYEELGYIKDRRHRIEHASLMREEQIEKMARLGIVASVQPHFVITDWWAKRRVGDRVKWLYSFKRMIDNGIPIGFGTDSPVEPIDPWETIYAAVTRGKYEGVEYYEDTKDESLELGEALNAYTSGSAYVIFEEKDLGRIEEGKLADFIVVDRDPFEVEETELRRIKVLETYVGGERVYKK